MKLTKEEKKELRLNFLFGAQDGEPKPLHLLARLEARKLWRQWEADTSLDESLWTSEVQDDSPNYELSA
tara:strand:+ start:406 stop:612 length:207 start_codon:yes stop_codon:yes gene_type:complete